MGQTDLSVSKLCYGSLTLGPLQADLDTDLAAELIAHASDKGINFIDTAALYGNYEHIKKGIKKSRKDWIVSSKSYDYDAKGMKASLEKARVGMDRDVIDLFMLHETESEHTIRGHWEAFEYLLNAKSKGMVRAVGVSTHRIEGVRGANKFNEIDVIHPIFNFTGLGIEDGSVEEMESAIIEAHLKGKGIFAMKPLGGGNLISQREIAFDFLKSKNFIHSIAIGMQSFEEIDYNVLMIKNQKIPEDVIEITGNRVRTLHIDEWCNGCAECIKVCGQKALKIKDGRSTVDVNKCVLCSYCSSVCPLFCIKVV
nr:aldo/keto reductase [Alkalibacter mobilis]